MKYKRNISEILKRMAGFGNEDAIAALEFAIIAPIMFLILAAAVDFGYILYVNLKLNSAASAAANYVLVNASNVGASGADSMATTLASLLAGVDVSISVNNGINLDRAGQSITKGGNAANADRCYCPKFTQQTVSWGGSVGCSTPCSEGGMAGRFVALSGSVAYSPVFFDYGIAKAGRISFSTIVRAR